MTVRDALLDAVLDALAVLMPVSCASCQHPDRSLCAACTGALLVAERRPAGLQTTGLQTAELQTAELFHQYLTVGAAPSIEVVSALRYEGTVRRIILSFKQNDRTDVARALASPLAIAVRAMVAAAGDRVELAPVPSGRAAYRRRGYDPVLVLLRRAGFAPARILTVVASRAQQKKLGTLERFENVTGSMTARTSLVGRRFVIVDDVVTTGATISEAARAIIQAGGTVCGAATLAFTPRLLPIRDIGRSEDYRGAKGAQ